MISLETLANFLYNVYSFAMDIAKVVESTAATIIQVNYYAVSVFVSCLLTVSNLVINVIKATFYVISVLTTSLADFALECYNFLHAFLLLLWKFILLMLSVLDIVFKGAEQCAFFLWSGGSWTVGAVKISLINFKDTLSSVLQMGGDLGKHMCTAFSNGVVNIGTLTIAIVSFLLSSFKWLITSVFTTIDNAMMFFADNVRFCVDSVYYFITYTITSATKETYYGMMMLVLLFLLIVNIHSALLHRGMTFPFMYPESFIYQNAPRRQYTYGRTEFSDDDVSEYDYEDDNDNDSIGSVGENDVDDSDDENSVDEFSVIDDSDEMDDELSDDASDVTSRGSDIDVQLPSENDSRYNLRRSTTPSRSNRCNPEEELEKERERNMCVICQDNKKSVLILPCRHMCLCVACGHKIAKHRYVNRRTCPLCRQRIKTIMNVYL